MVGLLERLAGQPPDPRPTVERAPKNRELLMLDWLQNRWTKSSVTLRDIQTYGPGSVRNKDVALNLMHTLTTRRWVVAIKPHRYDMKRWGIPRRRAAQPQPTSQLQP
jgi:hypothetical protein